MSEFYDATDEEMAAEIRYLLNQLGLTFDELAAKDNRFDTELQRQTWFAIKDLGALADCAERDARFLALNDRIWGAGNWVKCAWCVDNLGNPAFHHKGHHS